MNVELARSAGFCFGVKEAMKKVYNQIETNDGKKIYTYGPIIHNEEVVKELEKRGVTVIAPEDNLDNIEKGIVVIRSHGVPKKVSDDLENAGFILVDATCPFVKRIHNIVEKESESGKKIVIIGNDKHPEVE